MSELVLVEPGDAALVAALPPAADLSPRVEVPVAVQAVIDANPRLRWAVSLADNYARESLSQNTRAAYASAWRGYVAWAGQSGFDPFGPPGQLAIYLALLAEDGKSVATVTMALCAVCKAYEAKKLPSPREDRAVKLVYSGIRRKCGTAPDQVAAILPDQLRKMVEAMPQGPSDALRSARDRAMLLVGWSGGLRRSEVVGLQVADLRDDPDGVILTIRKSKTDQEGKGRTVAIPYASWVGVCPVRSLRAWLEQSGIKQGPIFRPVFGASRVSVRALTDRQLANVVRDCAARAGIEGHFAGHSLRSGFVTSAVKAGKRLDAVMRQTGHKTVDMLLVYVRQQRAFTDNAAAGLL